MYTDSGSLSLKEFQQLFSDGIMTSEELQELFHLIDTEKTNTLSHSELLAYFQLYMADFEPIFSLTDDLSVAITNNLKSTHNKHQSTIKLEMVEEEEVTQDSKNTIVVVHMFLEASESNVSAFRQSLKNYVQSVTNESGCLQYYWYNHVIHVSDDIGIAGEFNWLLLTCLFCAWLITYLCLFRGIKSSGKRSNFGWCWGRSGVLV
ncbi:N-terminal EF-hand calcium-binding protein 1-like isoform X3 [Dysidea avara]|uniref:N-terminal EF-hand calcium-binding protein 1-like isoform X3 n=1 Tax=Dysidea avara TaxID=196820 RepID=UPI00332BC412